MGILCIFLTAALLNFDLHLASIKTSCLPGLMGLGTLHYLSDKLIYLCNSIMSQRRIDWLSDKAIVLGYSVCFNIMFDFMGPNTKALGVNIDKIGV